MRVLFSTPPALGHIFPLVPLAAAAHAAGHDVLFAGYGNADELGLYDRTGFPTVSVGDGSSLDEMYARWAPGRRSGLGERSLPELLAAPVAANSEMSRATIGPLRDLVEAWRPDVMVYDPFQGAVPLVAAEVGILAVEHQFGPVDGREISRRVAERLGAPDRPGRAVSLDACPPSLRARDRDGWPMRYVPFHGPGVVPAALVGPATTPRVLLTLGTAVVRSRGLSAIGPLLEEAADVDAEFVLPVPAGVDPPAGSVPGNVKVHRWMPLLEVLRHCDAVVHHGGAGTMLAAVTQSVPQLILPQNADQFVNAEVAVAAGFALRGSSSPLVQLRRLLEDERFRESARTVRAENERQATPARTVSRLAERVAGTEDDDPGQEAGLGQASAS